MTCVDWFGDRSVLVAELPLACCAAEFEAGAAGRPRVEPRAGERVALVVSGTVTTHVAPALAARVDTLREAVGEGGRVNVLAFGACASGGGPYWDSPAATTANAVVDVDAYVPGCAPSPAALTAALEGLR